VFATLAEITTPK